MTAEQEEILAQFVLRFFADRPTQRPSEWCVENLRFDEADNHGPFSLSGAEYCTAPLDDFADPTISDEVLVWGSQTRKTGCLMGGTAWCVVNDPCGILWAMPSIHLAQSFSRNRWQKLLRASKLTAELIPTGQDRYHFKNLEQVLGASVVAFFGANSPGNLSSTPRRRVILDEVDKFNEGTKKETDAVNLAEQRTKGQPNPQRWKTSTPTIVEGLIWQEALKGDMQRYEIPCKSCNRPMILAWSATYTVLPKTGKEAYIFWDREARRDDDWDLDRVFRSARAQCPHCGFHNLDAHKTWQNRNGVWVPTKSAAKGFRSRHLPSLYSCCQETTYGALAVKFLQAKQSLLGLQGFINGDLAEPFMSQDRQQERVEIITSKVEVTAEWKKILTIDCQQKSPLFWYVVRAWNGGDSNGVSAGHFEQWEDVEDIQRAHRLPHHAVVVDSGFGARSDADVYANCARHGEWIERDDAIPLHFGWVPAKGMPDRKRWKDENGLLVPYRLASIDPFHGFATQGQGEMSLFEFSGEYFKDILDALRRGKGGHRWTVDEAVATEEYWRHLDAEIKDAVRNTKTGKTVHRWQLRNKHWPNHLNDCEVMQIAYVSFLGLFVLPTELINLQNLRHVVLAE